MHKKLIFLFVLTLTLISVFQEGCSSIPNREVSANEFIELYNEERYVGNFWEYKGTKGGKHIMIHYTTHELSVPTEIESIAINVDKLPSGFPEKKQKDKIAPPLPAFMYNSEKNQVIDKSLMRGLTPQ